MIRKAILLEINEQRVKKRDLSADTGITQSIISNFLRGKSGMSIENIEKVMKYLGLYITSASVHEIRVNETLLNKE